MKHIKKYHQLFELVNYGLKDVDITDCYLILVKGDLYLFDDDNYGNFYEKIAKDLNIEGELEGDIYSDFQHLKEELPYILHGEIKNGVLYLDGTHDYRHSILSTDLKKVMNYLKTRGIRVDYYTGFGDTLNTGELDVFALDKNESVIMYHGTCTKYIENIIKKGIIPAESETNFDGTEHKDKIFLSSNIEKALFHAFTAATEKKSFPVIISTKIPNPHLLISDYDISTTFYGGKKNTDYPVSEYPNIRVFDDGGKYFQNFKRKNLDKKLGVFGYKGSIKPSFFQEIWMDTEGYSTFYSDMNFEGEVDLEKILNDIRDLNYWDRDNIKYYLERKRETEAEIEGEGGDDEKVEDDEIEDDE